MCDSAARTARFTAGLLAMLLGCGCGSAPPPPSPAPTAPVDELRQRLTQRFAAKQSRLLSKYYVQASASGTARDERFYQLTRIIDERPPMPGILCMELLGPADGWRFNADGSETLVYFFVPNSGVHDACFLQIGADGEQSAIGYNRVGANRYKGFQFRSGVTPHAGR